MRPGSDTVATLTPYAIADTTDARAGVNEILRRVDARRASVTEKGRMDTYVRVPDETRRDETTRRRDDDAPRRELGGADGETDRTGGDERRGAVSPEIAHVDGRDARMNDAWMDCFVLSYNGARARLVGEDRLQRWKRVRL